MIGISAAHCQMANGIMAKEPRSVVKHISWPLNETYWTIK